MKSKLNNQNFTPHRSIFQKYLGVCMMIIIVSMIALGITMLFFVANYWENEKKDNLIENANQVASVVVASSDYNVANHTLVVEDPELFTVTISTMAQTIDADIFVVNNKGVLQYCSETGTCIHQGDPISQDILGQTITTNYFEFGTLDGFYDTTYYTAGAPVVVNEAGEEIVVGFCYVSSKSTFVAGLTMTMMKMFIIAAIITMLISLVLVGFLSYNMARPLREMSQAAKKFAVGDFSSRVKVRGNDEMAELAVAFII